MIAPKILPVAALLFFSCSFCIPPAFCTALVEGSSEDLYWSDPVTIHDYKKKEDLHNAALSAMALSELQFVRLGDGLLNFTTRSKKSPISRSIDSLEYAYSKLPRVEPVERFGQFWDALQIRELSLSDARLIGSILDGGYGGITPVMQVRVYKLMVWVEDILYDVDRAVMSPVNWGISSVRKEPAHVQSLGYVADGLGLLRWEFSGALKYVSQKVGRVGADLVLGIEKGHDALIRRKQKKKHAHVLIYSKMPPAVFEEYRSTLTDKKGGVFSGTLTEWDKRIFEDPALLPEDIRGTEVHLPQGRLNTEASEDVIVAAEYRVWDKAPRELRKYVITPSELAELVRSR